MKTITLPLFLLLCISAFSQITYQVQFEKELNQWTDRMIITEDGGSIIAAYEPDPIKTPKIFLSKIKDNGKFEWGKTYEIENRILFINDFINTKGNGFILCLRSTDLTGANQYITIFKADDKGSIEWKKKISTISLESGESYTGKLCESKDGGFYYLQQNSKFFNDYKGPNCSLYKFDSTGDIKWKNQFFIKAESDYGTSVTDITEAKDNSIVLAVTTLDCEAYCHTVYFMKFKASGKPEEQFRLNKSFFSYGNPVQLLIAAESNNISYIMEDGYSYIYTILNTKTGKARNYSTPRNIFNLQRFLGKQSIDEVKGKTLKKFISNIYGFDYEGNLVNGTYGLRGGIENILIRKYDKFGRNCTNFEIPNTDSVTMSSSIFVKSTFHLALNEDIAIEEGENINVVVLNNFKTICIGKSQQVLTIQNSSSVKAGNSLNNFKINPNPAKSILTIQGIPANTTSYISIISLQGKICQQVITNSKTLQLNVSTLSRGIYILKVQDKNNVATQKFIKE